MQRFVLIALVWGHMGLGNHFLIYIYIVKNETKVQKLNWKHIHFKGVFSGLRQFFGN